MQPSLKHIFQEQTWHWQPLIRFQNISHNFLNSRWPLIVLLLLGLLRAIFFLAAYAPADGADAGDYYNYAAYISGLDMPPNVANVSPVYPHLIYFFYYLLGNLNLLIFFQIILSSGLGVLIFLALRHYSPWLALGAALLVLGDSQIGILFDFVSTEPAYIFLLCLSFTLALYQGTDIKRFHWLDIIFGFSLVLLRETRTVGAYLFIPILILFVLKTRNWRRILTLIISFALGFAFFNTSLQVSGTGQAYSANENMYMRPLLRANLLNPDAGDASSHLQELLDRCKENHPELARISCMAIYEGSIPAVNRLGRDALFEVVRYDFPQFASVFFESFRDFLLMSGKQYFGMETPADVQCENPVERADRNADRMLDVEWVNLEISVNQKETIRQVVRDYTGRLCPPWWTNLKIRYIVEYIATRYASLSRPQPIIWHGFMLVLVVLIPWARKLWYPVFLAGGIWLYHAAISAAVLNVQPRYVVVTNPFKAVLISVLFYIILKIVLRMLDYFVSRKSSRITE